MKTQRHACGCISRADGDREQWHQLCERHEAEFQAIHQEAARQHAEQTKDATERLVNGKKVLP